MKDPQILDGDKVLIYYDKRRQWLRTVTAHEQFHSDKGFINFDSLIDQEFGQIYQLKPHNHKVAILNPLPSDIIFHMKRSSQIIYPEDLGLILTMSGIKPGFQILEAGTGSGTVSSLMAMFSGPTTGQPAGHIYTFDIRDIALKQAKKNIAHMGMTDHVTVQKGNILEDTLELPKIDFVMLDLATTWDAVPHIIKYLKPDSTICCFSPTLEQVKKNIRALQTAGFHQISSMELLKRTFQVKPNATRPHGRMIGHTGYLTFARLSNRPLLDEVFHSYYTPENIGNLLLYGGLTPTKNILLLTTLNSEPSALPTIFQRYFPLGEALHVVQINPVDPPESILEHIFTQLPTQLANNHEIFDSIVVDNIENGFLVKYCDDLLKKAGTFCVLSQYIENVKIFYKSLMEQKYIDLVSCEFIKREIAIGINKDDDGGTSSSCTHSLYLPSEGYVTIGRKVVDNTPKPIPTSKTIEFVEPLLDVGVGLPDSLPKNEPAKIDYANLEE